MSASSTPPPAMGAREFNILRAMIHRETGISLQNGRQMMLASRLAARLCHHGLRDFAAYAALVERREQQGGELIEMINCVTTNKTAFFREMHHFDFLEQALFSLAANGSQPARRQNLRIWSAACSTGEEPYSIAMTLLEAFHATASPAQSAKVRSYPAALAAEIVASDIDTRVLAEAAQGIYEGAALKQVLPPLKKKYFLRGEKQRLGQVRVKREVRDLVRFQRINLMDSRWPIEGRFDVIFFRNALIYFDRVTQEHFLRRMLGYLKPQGYLFLGHAEHVPWLADSVKALGDTVYQLLPHRRPPYTGPDRRRRAR